MSASEAQRALVTQLAWAKVLAPVDEHRFHPTRRWRFDLAWPSLMLAVEVEGGSWTGGRHTQGAGFAADCVKYNEAMLMGWRVLRVTPSMIADGDALALIERAIRMCLATTRLYGPPGYPWDTPLPGSDASAEPYVR